MANLPEVIVEPRDSAVLVTVVGAVDNATAYRLRTELGGAMHQSDLQPDGRLVVVDLMRVSFLGTYGLSTLVETDRKARQRGKLLRVVVGQHRPAIRPIQLNGLDRVLTLCNSVADALAEKPLDPHVG